MNSHQIIPSDHLEFTAFRESNLEKFLRSDLKFTTSKYFVERWMPNFGLYPKGFQAEKRRSAGQAAGRSALLILDLRQFARWEKGKSVRISLKALAKRHNKSVRTIQTTLKEPLIKYFLKDIPQYYVKNGQRLRGANKYAIRQDDPAIPQDIEHLIDIWEDAKTKDPTLSAYELLEITLKKDPGDLRAPNAIASLKHPEWFANGDLSVVNAIKQFCPKEKIDTETRKVADLIQHAIVQPEETIGGTKYFREKWMPFLGAAGWLLLLLKNQGFIDKEKKIERDIVAMESSQKYAEILGVSPAQIIKLIKHDLAEWVDILSEDKQPNQSIKRTLKVFIGERLKPEDENKLRQLYEQESQDVPRNVACTENKVPGNVACIETGVLGNVAHTAGEVPRNVAQIQIPLTYTSGDEKEHTIQIPPPLPQRQPDDGDDDAQNIELPEDLLTMLNKMGWNDTTTIIEKHYIQNAERVIEWAKYALKKSDLTNRAGYFRKRLASGEKAPKTLRSSATRGNRDRYRMDKYADYYD